MKVPFCAALIAALAIGTSIPKSSEAALLLYRSYQDEHALTPAQVEAARPSRATDFLLVFGIPIYGILQPLLHLPKIFSPAVGSALTVLIFLDEQVKTVDELLPSDLINNGYTEDEAKIAAQDSERFRRALEASDAGIGIQKSDTPATIADTLREFMPDASRVFLEVQAKILHQRAQLSAQN